MKTKILFSVIALVALAGGVAHAGGAYVASEIGYAISQLSSDDIADTTIARTSFGNVPSAYDGLRQPWQYPHIDANRTRHLGFTPRGNGIQNQLVWTQLGNTTDADTLGFAYLGAPCEKGLIGAQFSYSTDEYDFVEVDTLPSFVNTDLQKSTYRMFSGYVGYGWAPSDEVSHGVGVSIRKNEDDFRDSFFTTGSGGSRFESLGDSDLLHLTYGVRFSPRDNFSWTLEGHLATGGIESFGRSSSIDAMGMVSSSSTFGYVDLDQDDLGIAGRFNWYPNENWDYEIRWSYGMSDYNLNNTAIDFATSGGMMTAFQNATSDDIEATDFTVRGGVAHHDGPLHIYGGLGVSTNSVDVDVTGDFDNPMSFQFRQAFENSFTTIEPTVAFVYEFNEHVALIGAAEYSWTSDEFEETFWNLDIMTPANNSMFYESDEYTDNESRIRAGVELRFEKLIVDIGVRHSEDDGLESVDADDVFFSARFGF